MTLDDLKGSLAARLPERAAAAVAAYDAFSATPAPDDAKGFAAHHAACKAALAHVEVLVKLLRWAAPPAVPAAAAGGAGGGDDDLARLIAAARSAMTEDADPDDDFAPDDDDRDD
ncbi:hypothetical protein [Caenispirillum bisanense]|uniref:Uncharacterized protein n=1 Tax=Caenispirillum bisanense TaxID=414052 RepID=A0A286GAG6_9PROT|nr:hypothetical protein [Caenispirillum bisanense]SOD92537.1 hypothetical protein SAMN05421508_102484 [Caenispirillum bisanense]